MKYEKPNMNIIDLSEDIIVTSFLEVDPEGGNDPDDDIVITPIN